MKIFERGDISVYAMRPGAEMPRGVAERCAVEALVAEAFGGFEPPVLVHEPSGAPRMEGDAATVSVSHCAELVVIAIDRSGHAIGVDAESETRGAQLRRVAAKFLSAQQMPRWCDNDAALLRAWTLKEALYKAMLTPGLPLAEIPLPLLPQEAECGGCVLSCRGRRFMARPLFPDGFGGDVTLVTEIY